MKTQAPYGQQILKDEFSRRSAANPRYSLRSFAKALDVSPTILSLVMSGKRPLAKKTALKIADRLALTPLQMQLLMAKTRPQAKEAPVGASAYEFDAISLETFSVISDWIHYAILSLLEIPNVKSDAKWIAKALNINEVAAQSALDRLQQLGMIKKSKGKWKQSSMPIKVENKVSTSATRKFQAQLLQKAMASLENDPIEVRDFSSMTLAIDPELIPYAIEKIRAFRRELTADLESKGNAKEVYNLTVQIFPVSKVKGV
jgi:uncharacterized protein (TIGR02147 family)